MKPQGTRKRLTQETKLKKRAKSRAKGNAETARKRTLTDLLDAAFKPLR